MITDYIFSDVTLKVISSIKNNTKISGILTAKIPDIDKQILMHTYNVEDFLVGLYCFAKELQPVKCENCGAKTNLLSLLKGFRKFCSVNCSNQINNKKFNIEKGKTKTEKFNIKNYPNLKLCVDEYLNPKNLKSLSVLSIEYNLSYFAIQKYITDNKLTKPSNIKSKLQLIKTKEKYPELFDSKFFLSQQKLKKSAKIVAKELGVSHNTICIYSRTIGVPFLNTNGTSCGEHEIGELFKSYEIIRNSRKIISPFEIDIFLPKFKLGIEYNGAYWHSELNGKDKHYHIKKQLLAEEQNIKLIQIFDFEWNTKRTQIEGYLKSLLNENIRIYARNTSIKSPSKQQTKEFFEKNHIHGNVGYKFSYGLYDNNGELISLLSIGKSRYSKKYDYEVLRFCNKIGVTVVGGLSKIISHIKNNLEFSSLVSYTHRRLFDGKSFINAGFNLVNKTDPGYFWANKYTHDILTRYKTQKHKLNTTLTEKEYMESKNYNKVWDCGQLVFCLYK